jgi:hypothetical protein
VSTASNPVGKLIFKGQLCNQRFHDSISVQSAISIGAYSAPHCQRQESVSVSGSC